MRISPSQGVHAITGIAMSYITSDLDPMDWEALGDAWKRFTTKNPHLGLSSSDAAAGRFARKHFPQLSQQGVMVKGVLGRYLTHRERFPSVAFSLLIENYGNGNAPKAVTSQAVTGTDLLTP